MASLNRSIPLSRAFRALSFHPPIPPAPHLPASASKRLHLRTISSSTARSLPPRRPKYPDTLPYNQHLYSIGYPQDSLDDLSPPLANVDIMSLPNPLTLIAVGGSANYASMTNESIVYICNRHDLTSYSCSCPAWRVAKGRPVDARTCKHLRSLLGDAHENARCHENKTTVACTPDTNPINIRKKEREEARIAAGKGPSKPSKAYEKRPTSSLLDSSSTNATAGPSAPKRARQASSTARTKTAESSDGMDDEGRTASNATGGKELLLAHKFDLDGKVDPKGWWISEKLDGVRAYWDGQSTLWSRTGKALAAPKEFLENLPRGRSLDGELYIGRNRFDETSGIIRSLRSPRWNEIKYMVFDAPFLSDSPFEDRLARLESMFPSVSLEQVETGDAKSPVVFVKHEACQGMEDLKKKLVDVQKLGGEGLMLRQSGSLYVGKRSKTLLKVKTFYDAEAKVIGYEAGKGKYEGMTGSLVCQMQDGKTTFSVGSGLTDERRHSPPAIGSIITYRFFELTKQNIPRFPTFVGERIDAESAHDAVMGQRDPVGGPAKASGSNTTGKGKANAKA